MTAKMTLLRPGMLATVQDHPGRVGYWQVGVPPSGPMDDLSFRLGNVAVGNPEGAAGIEAVMAGPAVQFDQDTVVCVSGAPVPVTVDGVPRAQWQPIRVPAGAVLDIGTVSGPGLRMYLSVRGAVSVDEFLGSAATFTLGRFGGHEGRALRVGDILTIGDEPEAPTRPLPSEHLPALGTHWELAVTEGPHGAPEFFTRGDIDTLYATDYEDRKSVV